jgi:hypothetical protein
MSQVVESSGLIDLETEALLDMLGSVIDGRTATYVSVPITTGLRFVEWVQSCPNALPAGSLGDEDYRRNVVEPNRVAAGELIRLLRRSLPGAVIDPTALGDIPGWSQADYHALWARVIERYARRILLGEGWEYSRGCTFEYLTAIRSGIEALDAEFCPITLERGIASIAGAIACMKRLGQDADFLETIWRELSGLASHRREGLS